MSNIEHRAVIKFFTRKGLNATEIRKELNNVYKDSTPSYHTVAKWVAEFKDIERGFEGAPRSGRPATITTDENIQVIERIVMRDRQISVRCIANELTISKSRVHDINRVECCQELLQESEESPTNFYDRIVTGDETWVYFYDTLSQQETKVWKRSGKETPPRLR